MFPWYDSLWLRQYVLAKAYLSEARPRRLSEFVSALAPLRTRPDFQVQHVARALDEEVLSEVKTLIRSLKLAQLEMNEARRFGRFVVRDNPNLTRLQETKTTLVSDLAGEPVAPSYNFLSMYTALGRCPLHMDAPDAKWTLDICIDQSEPWDIHLSQVVPWPESLTDQDEAWSENIRTDPGHVFTSHALKPGEALVFSGSSQWHYRDPLPHVPRGGGFAHLVFFHFIPQGLGEVVDPRNWARIFDVPELARIVERRDGRETSKV